MMPLLLGPDTLWWKLESLEDEYRRADGHSGYMPYDDHDDREARSGRVDRVRSALFFSGVEARSMLTARLAGIDLSTVIQILLDACKDVAMCWGGSVLAGGAFGATFGTFAGGVGAIPGAAIGAGMGTQIGAWVLGMLGLKALIEDLGTAVPDALRHYEGGLRMAWGPVRRWESAESMGMDGAAHELALGHVVLMTAMLSALLAYLTRSRGNPAAKVRLLQEIRQSPRLGPKVADWVAANEDVLARHPGLKPKERQVMMSQAKPPAEPPMTPSQLRKATGRSGDDQPPPRKPEPPAQPKVTQPNVEASRGVEIVDRRGSPLGEFDRIEGGVLVEEKSAKGLGRLNPRTGLRAQTAESWAERRI